MARKEDRRKVQHDSKEKRQKRIEGMRKLIEIARSPKFHKLFQDPNDISAGFLLENGQRLVMEPRRRSHREQWAIDNPYSYLLDENKKVAYPLNRLYKNLGNGCYLRWIDYPLDATIQLWVYDYKTDPNPFCNFAKTELQRRQVLYAERCAKIRENYIAQATWDTGLMTDEISDTLYCGEKAFIFIPRPLEEKMYDVAIEKGGECLAEEFLGRDFKVSWRCATGHIWKATPACIVFRGTWCPNCLYKTENECREIIEEFTNRPFPKQRPTWLQGLELDGYCAPLKLAFEYQGQQHYHYFPHWHKNGEKDLQEQQRRDVRKLALCWRYGVAVVIIPYWIKDKHEFIREELLEIFRLRRKVRTKMSDEMAEDLYPSRTMTDEIAEELCSS